MEPALTDLITWARQAGEIVRAGYGKKHTIRYKSAVDLVTDTDHRSEDFLIDNIRRNFPDHSIITEESGDLAGLSSRRWFIDPLDGTINFSHNMPLFAISLGYAVDGEVRLGVIYDPLRDECFSAERGKGAFLNDEPMHVSDTPDLIHSLLVTGFPYDMWETPNNNLDHFVNFARRCQSLRRLGSAALDLAYVATGRLDGYWEIRIKPWDIAAGTLLVEEAGGVVTKINGSREYLTPPYDVLATTPRLLALMLEVFRENLPI
jgi:myo-inositol-1(or 4)-monophosphatase